MTATTSQHKISCLWLGDPVTELRVQPSSTSPNNSWCHSFEIEEAFFYQNAVVAESGVSESNSRIQPEPLVEPQDGERALAYSVASVSGGYSEWNLADVSIYINKNTHLVWHQKPDDTSERYRIVSTP